MKFIHLLPRTVVKIQFDTQSPAILGTFSLLGDSHVVIVARSHKQMMIMLSTLTHAPKQIGCHFSDFGLGEDYYVQVVTQGHQQKTGNKFFIESFVSSLHQTLNELNIRSPQLLEVKHLETELLGVTMGGKLIAFKTIPYPRPESCENETVRNNINMLNAWASFAVGEETANINSAFDLLYTEKFTPLPKLTAKAHLLWELLNDENYQFLLLSHPYIHDKVKNLILDPYHGIGGVFSKNRQSILEYLKPYNDYVAKIKKEAIATNQRCIKAFQTHHFQDAKKEAKLTITTLNHIHAWHIEEESVTAHYNLGSALVKLEAFEEARIALQAASHLSQCLKETETVYRPKINEKLRLIEAAQKSSLSAIPISAEVEKPLFHQLEAALKNGDGDAKWVQKNIKMLLLSELLDEKDLKIEFSNPNDEKKITLFHLTAVYYPEGIHKIFHLLDKTNFSPLHRAVMQGNLDPIKKLVNANNVNTLDSIGCSLLWWALALRNLPLVNYLVSRKAETKEIVQQSLPILNVNLFVHLVMTGQHTLLLPFIKGNIISRREVFYAGNFELKSLVALAAEHGNIHLIRLLFKYGHSLEVSEKEYAEKLFQDTFNNFSVKYSVLITSDAICAAARKNQIEVLNLLLNIGLSPNKNGIEIFEDYKEKTLTLTTPLVEAVKALSPAAVELLLTYGASTNKSKHVKGRSNKPLERNYIWEYQETPLTTLLKLSSKFYKELRVDDYDPDVNKFTLSIKWFQILTDLIKAGADVNSRVNGKPAYMHLITGNVVSHLIPFKEEQRFHFLNEKSNTHQKQIEKNLEKFILKALKILFKAGAFYNQQDDKGKTLLHYAVERKYYDIVCYLVIEAKVNLELTDNEKQTPLDIAKKFDDPTIAHFLAEKMEAREAEETSLSLVSLKLTTK